MRRIKFVFFTLMSVFSIACVFGANISKEEVEEMRKEIKGMLGKLNLPNGVHRRTYLRYLLHYAGDYEYGKIKTDEAKKTVGEYFGSTEYKVIWYWDVDGDGLDEYMAIEPYKNVRRAFKRAICVDEKGKIKLYIDTIKGVYAPEYEVVSLEELGIKKGEVECYTMGFERWIKGNIGSLGQKPSSNKSIREEENKYKNYDKVTYTVGHFMLQRLDKDMHVIGTLGDDNLNSSYISTDYLGILYHPYSDKAVFVDDFFTKGGSEYIESQKKDIVKYRSLKKQGKTYSPPAETDKNDVKLMKKIFHDKELDKVYGNMNDSYVGGQDKDK